MLQMNIMQTLMCAIFISFDKNACSLFAYIGLRLCDIVWRQLGLRFFGVRHGCTPFLFKEDFL